ncbi:hypothetical protein [Caballeronia grimmiae]|uniref:hypothetical protein n=1 Tax=Caballeronia grimmiae TaxID=1071679 RepID=UPI0038B8740A
MLRSTVVRACLLALTASLTACGGGGGGNSASSTSTATTTPPVTAEGLYSGTTSTGYQLAGLVLETGEYYVLYSKNNTIYGVVQGNGTSNNGSFSSSNAFDFFLPNSSRTPATVSATYTAKQSLQGTLTEAGQGVTFTSTYQSSYDTPASLSAIAGTYSGASATGSGTAPISLTVSANGSLSGTSTVGTTTCGYSGTLTPRSTGKNVFNVSVTFNGSNCALGTATVAGYAVPVTNGTTTTLYAVGLLPDRSNGFLAIGTKN